MPKYNPGCMPVAVNVIVAIAAAVLFLIVAVAFHGWLHGW